MLVTNLVKYEIIYTLLGVLELFICPWKLAFFIFFDVLFHLDNSIFFFKILIALLQNFRNLVVTRLGIISHKFFLQIDHEILGENFAFHDALNVVCVDSFWVEQ